MIDRVYHTLTLLGLTVRLVSHQDGSKQVLPVSYCRNEFLNKEAWRLKGFSDDGYKPIYHMEKVADNNRQVLIVEGEKTCDRAGELLPDYIVLSWLGGSNGAAKVNWQQLRGKEVVIWPDHDAAGIKAARTIGQIINEANGHIGKVTIIDPSQLEFNGAIHNNILPEKWDLADPLPVGLDIKNLKEIIKNCQQQNSSLSYTQALATNLQQLLPQPQELAIGERIFWQARSNGILPTLEQIRQEAAAEISWQEKLSSPEAEYYMQYAEKTGKGGSSHEFLKIKDALYRDTLVAIAANSKIKDQEALKLPELIQELQNEYEQKQRALDYGNAGRSFGEADHYQSHLTSLETYGSDRAELYQIMVRDVNLLHQEQLSRRGVRTTQTEQQAIYQEIYQQITTYQVRQTKGQASHKLDYDDQVKIASKIYDTLGSHQWWQSLVVQDLTHMHKLAQEAQEKMNVLQNVIEGEGKRIIEEARLWGSNLSDEQLRNGLAAIDAYQHRSYLEQHRSNMLNNYLKLQVDKFANDKLFSKTIPEVLAVVNKEQEFLLALNNNMQDVSYRYPVDTTHAISAARAIGDRPSLVAEVTNILEIAIEKEVLHHKEILFLLKNEFNLQKVYQTIDKAFEDHHITTNLVSFEKGRTSAKTVEDYLKVAKKEQEFWVGLEGNLKYPLYDSKLREAKLQAEASVKEGIISKLDKAIEYCVKNGVKTNEEIFSSLQKTKDLTASYIILDKLCENHHIQTNLSNFSHAKARGTVTKDILKIMVKEQEFLATLHDDIKYQDQYPKDLLDRINQAYNGQQENIIQELQKVTAHIGKYQVMSDPDLLKCLKDNADVHITVKELSKSCQDHYSN